MRFQLLLAVAVLAVLPVAPGAAQTAPAPIQKRPMTFADLQAMKRVGDPQVSPSGKWVLFSVTDVNLEKNTKTNHLWLVSLDSHTEAEGRGSVSEHQVTNGSGESNGRFSPDGKWVMYSADDARKGQIFLAAFNDAKGTMSAGHAVTHLETEADGAIWAPDSKHFLFTSNVYPDCESHAPLGRQRNEEEAECNAVQDAAAANDPVHALVFEHLLYRHWNQYQGPKHSHIFYASVSGEDPADLTPASVIGDHEAPTFSLGGPLGYAISPDGNEIAYVTNIDKVPAESTNNDIFVLQVGAEPATAKKVSTSPGSDDGPQYSPDGKWLAWRSQARNGYESDKFDLVVMDRATNTIKDLTAHFSSWIDEFSWSASSAEIFFVTPRQGREPVMRISLKEPILREMTKEGEFSSIQPAPDGNEVVVAKMTVTGPSRVVAIKTGPEESSRPSGCKDHSPNQTACWDVKPQQVLDHLNENLLNQLDLAEQESFFFSGANGKDDLVQGFIIRPPNFDASKKYPLKFLIHGGPQGAWGDAWSYRWNAELFAANGYVVVMINPRGSTGYGQKFLEEVSGDWGGRPYVDLMKGLDYAEAHYPFIDKTRECALGASYGGYMADWVLTHTHRFQCIVTHDGMYNPQSAFGDTEELWFNEWEFRPLASAAPDAVVEQTKPAHPWDFFDKPAAQDPFRKWSPMLNIKFAKTPTLIVHSQRDYRLDVSEGLQLFTALQLLNVPSKMLYFPDEGHWVLKPRNSELWYQTVNDWVDRWTHTNQYAAK